MAKVVQPKYEPDVPIGTPMSFNQKLCDDYCVVWHNTPFCKDTVISNYRFLGTYTNDWTIVTGTNEGTDPAQIKDETGAPGSPTVRQNITATDGWYLIYYSFEKTTLRDTWSGTFVLDSTGSPTNYSLFSTSSNEVEKGLKLIQLSSFGSGDIDMVFSTTDDTEIVQLNYLYMCEARGNWNPSTEWRFQLPLFENGSELLSISGNSITFAQEFNYTTDNTQTQDINDGACPNPSDNYINIAPTTYTGTTITQDTKLFHVISMGAITIDKGINIDDDEVGKLTLVAYSGAASIPGVQDNTDRIDFTESDANTDLFITGSRDWVTADNDLQLYVDSTSECNGTNEKTEYTVTNTNWAAYAQTYVDTFTAEDDTFYLLEYKLNKCSISSVEVLDSASVQIFQASANGVEFKKIFKTGSLPVDKTVTVKFYIGDLLDYPNADFNVDVLTDVTLYKMCKWLTWIETDSEVFESYFTETHDTTLHNGYSPEYHPNIEYSYDLNLLQQGCYQVRAIDNCDNTKALISNCYTVCDANPGLVQVAWTPSKVVCAGSEVIDYEAYPSTTYFWIKASLQDETMERDREFYRRADGYWETPYTYQNVTEQLVIWEMPPFLRQALSVGLALTFTINGVEYQMLNDDDISPLFNARYSSAIRIPVHRVGAFNEVRG